MSNLGEEYSVTVKLENLSKSYGCFDAVSGLNLTIQEGAFHFLLGPSGCGKTTTLRMLAGLESPTHGRLFIDGRDVTKLSAVDRGIGMVFQNYALWPHMSVWENCEYGLKIKKIPSYQRKKRVEHVLDMVQLRSFAQGLPGQHSGGQQQRVALARALAPEPRVLLLDEPLSNLDAKLRLEMREYLCQIQEETKITMIFVTHDQKEALSMGSEVTVLSDGRHIQTGTPRALYERPVNAFIAEFVGETNLVAGKISYQNGSCVVATHLGDFYCQGWGSELDRFRSGASVVLSIRPEVIDILWQKEQHRSLNYRRLKLQSRLYLGDSEQVRLVKNQGSPGAQSDLQAKIFRSPNHQTCVGGDVHLTVSPEKIAVLPWDQEVGLI